MGTRNIKMKGDAQRPFPSHQSYSIDEIMAAGGTTAFANKLGKNPQAIDQKLKDLPKEVFLSKEEAIHALATLNENK